MPTWAKVILIILLIGVLLVGALIFIAWRWVKNNAAEIEQGATTAVAEAQEFGKGKDAEACVVETLNRVDKCDGFICEAKTKIFLTNCLETANVPAEFCARTPEGIVAGASWAVEECQRRGKAGNQPCIRALTGIVEFCNKP